MWELVRNRHIASVTEDQETFRDDSCCCERRCEIVVESYERNKLVSHAKLFFQIDLTLCSLLYRSRRYVQIVSKNLRNIGNERCRTHHRVNVWTQHGRNIIVVTARQDVVVCSHSFISFHILFHFICSIVNG